MRLLKRTFIKKLNNFIHYSKLMYKMNSPFLLQIFAEAGIDILTINLLNRDTNRLFKQYKEEYIKHLSLIDKHSLFLSTKSINQYNDSDNDKKLMYVKLLIPYVNPSINNNIIFEEACYDENIDLAKILLQSPRFQMTENILRCARGNILKLLIDMNYFNDDSMYNKILFNKFTFDDNIKLLLNYLSEKYKHQIFETICESFCRFNSFDDQIEIIVYMIHTYDIDFDISKQKYIIVDKLTERGYSETFTMIFDKVPINMHETILHNLISYGSNLNPKNIDGCYQISNYILQNGNIFDDINTYIEELLENFNLTENIKYIKYLQIFLKSDRLNYISYKNILFASKSIEQIANLIFDSNKIKYSIIDEKIIDALIDCDHKEIAELLLESTEVKIEKNYDQELRKRKAVDDITLDYMHRMEMEIKIRSNKRQRC
jgi:hypothetical protein